MLKHYPITPIAKPRMTRADAITMRKLAAGKRLSDKERKRAPLLSRWLAYKNEVQLRRVDVPEPAKQLPPAPERSAAPADTDAAA